MKKALKLLATTTASALIATLMTSCGAEKELTPNSVSQDTQENDRKDENNGTSIKFTVPDAKASTDVTRCGIKCVLQDR